MRRTPGKLTEFTIVSAPLLNYALNFLVESTADAADAAANWEFGEDARQPYPHQAAANAAMRERV